MRKILKIPQPSKIEINYYLKLWNFLENYKLQESSLKKLFTKTYPLNNDLDDVLIKVCVLNDFYSTNIFSPFTVAKHIVSLKIDDYLAKNDPNLVNKIAMIKMKGGKIKNFYSFATKYCSHHKPDFYPIYDFYVGQMLWYFKKKDKFYEFLKEDFKVYIKYKNILQQFKLFYRLNLFSFKEIDKYLWQAGKKYFPRDYKK